MFGKNKILKQELHDGPYWVQEIFYTIQGEGPRAGQPAVFVRLAGCNLRCYFCDTDFESSNLYMTATGIAQEVSQYKCKLVVITGGEPFRQNLYEICKPLWAMGCTVQVETAGTLWQDELWHPVRDGIFEIVCSPKTGKVHEVIQSNCYHWKYIISAGAISMADGLPNMSTQKEGQPVTLFRPDRPADIIWLQPMMEYTEQGKVDKKKTDANTQLAAELCMKHGYRLTIQMHKVVGLP